MKRVYRDLVAVVGIAVTTAILFNAIFFVPIRLPWDAYYHVSRIENLRQSGLAFLYPQNFTTLGQYGLATNIFYPALTLQIVQTIFFFTHSAIQAFKISMIFTTFLSGSSAYIILRYHGKLGRKIAFFCSILWLSTIGITALAPGNIAESTAYIGIPWLAYGLYACSKETKEQLKKIVAHIAVGLSIAAYSHIMTFFILALFTAVYLFILLIKSNNKIKIVWVMTLGGIATLLSTAAAVGPILIVQLLNNVKKPVVNTSVFADNIKDLSHLFLNPSDSPDIWLPLFFIIICIIIGSRKPSLGVILGLIVMLLGTNFTPWAYYLRNSPVTFIQFATRFIKPGIALALMFTLLDLKANQKIHENTKRFHSGLVTYGLLSVIIMAGVMKNNWFPNSNSQLWTAQQLREYTTFYDGTHDGYGYSSDMTFSNQISNNERFWYLKNYTDYIPKSALSNPNDKSTFIGADKSGILLTKHQIIDGHGQTYNTSNYEPTLKSINMNVQKTIPSNSIIELPIVSYKGLRLNTTIDGKEQKTFIKHGKIALKLQNVLAANSKIKITQQVPNWLIVLNLVSAVTLVTLLSFHKRPQRADRLT